jgi:hypothetical protein
MRKILFFLAASVLLSAVVYAQDDTPSLGDVARQTRQQKQQKDKNVASKAASAKDSQTANAKDAAVAKPAQGATNHVITNEELPAHSAAVAATPKSSNTSTEPQANETAGEKRDGAAAQWKSQIQSQKDAVGSLQQQIASVSESIHYAGGNCVQNCAQWNERQQQKQQEVDTMKAQLEEQQKKLEDMQESARRQGFGSQVYDP